MLSNPRQQRRSSEAGGLLLQQPGHLFVSLSQNSENAQICRISFNLSVFHPVTAKSVRGAGAATVAVAPSRGKRKNRLYNQQDICFHDKHKILV